MPYWDHKKAIGFAGGLFAVPIYPMRLVPTNERQQYQVFYNP